MKTIKICKICGLEKDITITSSYCADCAKTYNKEYYQTHKESHDAYGKKWKQTHPEKVKESNKRYREHNLEKIHLKDKKDRDELFKKDPDCHKKKYRRHLIKYPGRKNETAKRYARTHPEIMRKSKIKYMKGEGKEKERLYNQKNRVELPDFYIADKLHLPVKELRQYPELIEVKRIQIKIVQELKKVS